MHQPIKLGLRENAAQFALLVLVNGFVGAMVGMERVIIPVLAETRFELSSHSAVLTFLITFGLAKALANLYAGRRADRTTRKSLLILGWLLALPVPALLYWAPSWSWVVVANILLGCNQGIAWTMTVVMKVDLVGPRQRGLALGINESAGYAAVSLAALGSGLWMAAGSPDTAFLAGGITAVLGLLASVVLVKDTSAHVAQERADQGQHDGTSDVLPFAEVAKRVSGKDRRMFAAAQAGMINNLNDGLAWGLLPLFFLGAGLPLERVTWLLAIYPLVWGLGQLGTGALADVIGRRTPIVLGMLLQGFSLCVLAWTATPAWHIPSMVGMGIGTALVYPALLALISDRAEPAWRSSALGVYRLWRDGGYVVGAIVSGLIADAMGLSTAVLAIGLLTVASGMVAAYLLRGRTS